MYHKMISKNVNIQEEYINKKRINEIINKMITLEEKYEDYYIYKDIFTKLYLEISEIDNLNDISQNNIIPTYKLTDIDYKYLDINKHKNKNKIIMDIMKQKEIK